MTLLRLLIFSFALPLHLVLIQYCYIQFFFFFFFNALSGFLYNEPRAKKRKKKKNIRRRGKEKTKSQWCTNHGGSEGDRPRGRLYAGTSPQQQNKILHGLPLHSNLSHNTPVKIIPDLFVSVNRKIASGVVDIVRIVIVRVAKAGCKCNCS